jgi:hypothetical protein
MRMKTQLPEPMGHNKGSPKRKVHSHETERSQINDLMIHFKLLEKQEQANPKQAEGEK